MATIRLMNTIGQILRFTDFGESHGVAIGGVLDGVPSKLEIDLNAIRYDLDRRAGRIGASGIPDSGEGLVVSERAKCESDEIEWLSGVIDAEQVKGEEMKGEGAKREEVKREGVKRLVTLGTPIAFIIRNTNAHPEDYEVLKNVYREGHADRVYEQKYGIRDYRGGGRASARETVARVVAGSIAKQILAQEGISVDGRLVQVGEETDVAKFASLLAQTKASGESVGGVVECCIKGLSAGVGEPIFDKLQARLAYAIMSINGCRSFSYRSGIVGGISNGEDIVFRCRFKATATKMKEFGGRHDVCIAVRAVPIVEAMAALTVCDLNMLR